MLPSPTVSTDDDVQFITITNPSEIHTHTNKRRVRSQAMRSFRQGKRRSPAVRPTLPLRGVNTANAKAAAASPSRQVGPPPLYGLLVPGPASAPSPGRVDPSVEFPIKSIDHSLCVSSASWKTTMNRTHSNRNLCITLRRSRS
jgi:hypothetical protein